MVPSIRLKLGQKSDEPYCGSDFGRNSNYLTPLHIIGGTGSSDLWNIFFEKAEEVLPVDESNMTPLHDAAAYGNIEVCQSILKKILDKNPKGESGCTPLHKASEYGYEEICELILLNVEEKEKNPIDNYGCTPLHRAAMKGHLRACEVIIYHLEKSAEMGNGKNCELTMDKNPNDNLACYLDVCLALLKHLGGGVMRQFMKAFQDSQRIKKVT